MHAGARIAIHDDLVPAELQLRLQALVDGPIWRYGWRSNPLQDRYAFWHAHFAGGDGQSRAVCTDELVDNPHAAAVAALWRVLRQHTLAGHELLRAYANAHTFGVEGYIHTDSVDEDNYFTTIYYAHPLWRRNWSGELVFFDAGTEEIIQAVYPLPGRVICFPGSIPHKAQAPSRECPELRVCIVFKTQLAAGR